LTFYPYGYYSAYNQVIASHFKQSLRFKPTIDVLFVLFFGSRRKFVQKLINLKAIRRVFNMLF